MSGKFILRGERLTVTFQAHLPEHKDFWECVHDAITRSKTPRKVIAGGLGPKYTEGQLSSVLSGREGRQFPLKNLPAVLEVLDEEASQKILNWIPWNFFATRKDRRTYAENKAQSLVPELSRLLELLTENDGKAE